MPEGAVFKCRDHAYVYRVDGDLVARQHEIEIGERRFGVVEVVGGLAEGDHIVTEGIIKLRDGMPRSLRRAHRAERISEPSPAAAERLAGQLIERASCTSERHVVIRHSPSNARSSRPC